MPVTHQITDEPEYRSEADLSRNNPQAAQRASDFTTWVYAQADNLYLPPTTFIHKDNQ